MASKTKVTETRRRNKRANMGKKRKAKLRSNGSTKSQAKLFGDEQ